MPRRSKRIDRASVGYLRISTEEQATEGVSLAAQEARIRAYALATGRELTDVVIDAGESGKSLQRPGISRVVEGIRTRETGTIIVLKLDRLTRSVGDLAVLLKLFEKHDVALVSVTENLDTASAVGRLMLNLLASVSQWEREAIGERTAIALGHKRSEWRVYGPAPFGWRREGDRLVPVLEEQDALSEMRRMAAAGATLRQIGEMLTARGVTPHRGCGWHASSVRAVLHSRMATEAASRGIRQFAAPNAWGRDI